MNPSGGRDEHAASALRRSGSTTLLDQVPWIEARTALHPECVVLLPIGAIEAHGPHLPLDTDVVIALEMARRGAVALNDAGVDAVILPAMPFGTSYVGACFPGTTPIPAEAVTATILSIIRSTAVWGPRRFCVVNAHLEPAHVAAIADAVAQANATDGIRSVCPDKRAERWAAHLSDEFRAGMRHAGNYETSLMLAAAPHRVRRDLLKELPPVLIDLPARLRAGATTFAEAGGTDGYFGDPAGASVAEGERLFAALGRMVATAVMESES